MKWNELTKEQSTIMKGAAILFIVIHNFVHLLPGPTQMEFMFRNGSILAYFQMIKAEPEKFIQFAISYFGHFGVQIFIFLSAYGLTKKFNKEQNIWLFIASRFSSIYPSFILAIILWAIVSAKLDYGALGFLKYIYWNIESIFYKIILISNFFQSEQLNLVGPWWFISFIFQLYFLYPLLNYLYEKYNNKAILGVLTVFLVLMTVCKGEIFGVNLAFTVLGHLPEICLGIWLAKNDKIPIEVSPLVLFFSILIFSMGNFISSVWFLSHISFLIIILWINLYILCKQLQYPKVKKTILFYGAISMQIFFINGFLREPFLTWAKLDNSWCLIILYCIASLVTTTIFAYLLFKFELTLRLLFTKRLKNNEQ